jgi:probable addiction module antidote protein
MAKVTVSDWDPAEIIETREDVIAFLEGVLKENDPEILLKIIGHIARSKGMVQVARELNLNRKGRLLLCRKDVCVGFRCVSRGKVGETTRSACFGPAQVKSPVSFA